jgi:hypothetical protein
MECREAAIHPASDVSSRGGIMGWLAGRLEGVEGRGMGGSGTLKLRNEPNFLKKKPMKVHKCPKNEPKTNPI